MKELRQHQTQAIYLLRQSLRTKHRRPMLCLSTGAGKTVIAAALIRMAREKNNRVTFVIDALSLIDQTVQAFYAEGLYGIGVIQSDHPMTDYSKPIQVASVQTLRRRGMPETDMLIVDEAHAKDKWLLQWMAENPQVVVIGLSATPWAKGLGNHYDDLVQPVTMQELIDQGYLCPFRVFAASKPDLSKVKTVAGEYHEGQLSDVMAEDGLIADVVETWVALSEGRPTLVFAVDCAHAQKLQERFAAADVPMGYVDAYTERLDRKKLAEQMKGRQISGIISVSTMIKGIDLEVGCISDCQPTKSKMRYVQKFGRGLRVNPGAGPDLIYLDHASNVLRHGFPTDINVPKLCTKQPGDTSEDSEPPPVKPLECAQCKQLRPRGLKNCPNCGYEAVKVSRIEEKDGELKEVKAKPKPEDKQRFFAELLGYAALKNKDPKWALANFRAKYKEWPYKSDLKPVTPTPSTIGWIKSRHIGFAKARQRA